MSFNSANLATFVSPSGDGNACAKYSTGDNIGTTLGAGYFTTDKLRKGDVILIVAADATWLCNVIDYDSVAGTPSVYNAIHI